MDSFLHSNQRNAAPFRRERKPLSCLFSGSWKRNSNSRIDDFSHDVVISQTELLLTYANRFYNRQFITRKVVSHGLLQKLEDLLAGYFNNEQALNKGIPTVQYLAENLNLSPSYLSDMLRALTGQNAQQHIHDKLIEKAKKNFLLLLYR